MKASCLNLLTSGSHSNNNKAYKMHRITLVKVEYPRNDLNVYDNKSAKLKFALSTNFSTRVFSLSILRVHDVCACSVT